MRHNFLCFISSFIFSLLIFVLALGLVQASAQEKELDEIVISATGIPTPASHIGSAVSVITAAEIRNSQKQYLPDILADIGAINISQNGGAGQQSNLFLRGMSSDSVAIILDGVPLNSTTAPTQTVNWEHLSVGGIERVEILRGAHSVLYGSNAIGGTIIIQTALAPEQLYLNAQAGSHNTKQISAGYNDEISKFAYAINASHFNTGGISAARGANFEADGNRHNQLSTRLAFEANQQLSFNLSSFIINSDTKYDAGAGRDSAVSKQDYEQRITRAAARYHQNAIAHELSFYELTEERTEISRFGPFFVGGQRIGGDYKAVLAIDEKNKLLFGLGHQQDEYDDRHNSFGGRLSQIRQTHSYLLWQGAAENIFYTLAARYDDHQFFDGHNSYRASLRLPLMDALDVRMSHGTGYRAPSQDELFGFGGDKNFQPEESRNSDIGLIWHPRETMRWEIGLFDIQVKNLISYNLSTFAYEQIGKSDAQGLELMGEWQLDDLRLGGNYTNLRANEDNMRAPRRPRHQLSLFLEADYSPRLSWRMAARMVRDVISINQQALDNYAVLDMSAVYRLDERIAITARVDNLTDEDYQTAAGYNSIDQSFYLGIRLVY